MKTLAPTVVIALLVCVAVDAQRGGNGYGGRNDRDRSQDNSRTATTADRVFELFRDETIYKFAGNVTLPRLRPLCSRELHYTLDEATERLFRFTRLHTMVLDCMSYQIMTNLDEATRNSRGCPLRLPHAMYIEVVDSDTQATVLPGVPIDDLFSGSLAGTALTFAKQVDVVFSVRMDAALVQRCPPITTATLDGFFLRGTPSTTDPIHFGISPHVVFHNFENAKFLFHSFSNVSTADSMVIVPEHMTCQDAATTKAANPTKFRAIEPQVTDINLLQTISEVQGVSGIPGNTFFQWEHDLETTGFHLVCWKPAAGTEYRLISIIDVYGSNPAYFSSDDVNVYGVAPSETQVITFNFQGYGLDGRSGADAISVVSFTEPCSETNAVGVVLHSGLSPALQNQERLSINISLSNDGSFKVCYKRVGQSWREVPYVDFLPYSSRVAVSNISNLQSIEQIEQNVAQTVTAIAPPVLVTPVPTKNCDTAPPRPAADIPAAKPFLELKFSSETLPANFLTLFADFLCLPTEFIFQHAFQKTATGATGIFEIRCLEGYCDSLERTDFVFYTFTVNSRSLAPMRITSVVLVDFDGVLVDPVMAGRAPSQTSDDNKDGKKGGKTITVVAAVLGALLLIVLIAVAFYCYIAHRRRFSRTSPEIVEAPVDGEVVRGVVLPASDTSEMSSHEPSATSTGKQVSYPPSATSTSAEA